MRGELYGSTSLQLTLATTSVNNFLSHAVNSTDRESADGKGSCWGPRDLLPSAMVTVLNAAAGTTQQVEERCCQFCHHNNTFVQLDFPLFQ